MPLYFAYGANLDTAAMARRCPASTPLGLARLMNHRFFIMREGYASVRRSHGGVVHGLLWDLALADVRSLDRFEEVGGGLYAKVLLAVAKPVGTAQALIYIGRSSEEGSPRPGYLESVLAAAQALGLPEPYRRDMARHRPAGPKASPDPDPRSSVRVAGVTARFATPFDRS